MRPRYEVGGARVVVAARTAPVRRHRLGEMATLAVVTPVDEQRLLRAVATAVATAGASETAPVLVRECAVRVSNPGPAD
jgi:hypothetical protein